MSSNDDEKISSQGLPIQIHHDSRTSETETVILHEEEYKRLLHKLDLHILPIVFTLYLFSFLDRANIGNANIAGLPQNLHLKGLEYNIAAAVFFVPYAIIEIPSNIALKFVQPSVWIPTMMLGWGIIMTLMCLVKSFKGFVVARIFLGLLEGGFFPGVAFYLSMWYPRRDVGQRIALWFSAAPLSGAFGGLFAYALQKMNGIGGLHGWQWIFCIEGFLTIVVALISYTQVHDFPEAARFLNERERKVVTTALALDRQGSTESKAQFVWQALSDHKTYIQMGIYLCILIPGYALALFLPSIIHDLGFSALTSQVLTIPIFTLACIVTLVASFFSDKFQMRGPFIICGCLIALIGFIILYIMDKRPIISYVGTALIASGIFLTIPIELAWVGTTSGGDIRKGVALAMVIAVGNLGGVCSSFIYISPPRFYIGHAVIMGLLSWAIILAAFSMWNYARINKRNIVRCQQEKITEARWEEFEEMGNDSPLFRYTL